MLHGGVGAQKLSIRGRLLLLVLFATAIPALLAGAYFHASREDQIAEARRSLVTFARYAISDLEDKIEGTVQFTYGLARARELDTRDRTACSAFLGTVLASHSQYTGILTIDPMDGCSAIRCAPAASSISTTAAISARRACPVRVWRSSRCSDA